MFSQTIQNVRQEPNLSPKRAPASYNIQNNIDGFKDYHTKWSKPDRERQIYGLQVESKKYDTNELIYKTETDLQT